MDYHCEVCNVYIKPRSKSRHFKSINHKKLDKHSHIKLTIDNPNRDNIDEIFYNHIKKYNAMYENYLIRCEFKICLIDKEDYGRLSSVLTGNRTLISWKIFIESAIDGFKTDGYVFSRISQMNIIIVCNKMDMTYDFYIKQRMPAIEWKINQIINKDRNLINKLPASGIHPLNRKLKSYRV